MGRLWRVRRPFPMLAAVFALVMLFMESYSIYGGNILSTLAGEFGYMLSFALVFLFLGTDVPGHGEAAFQHALRAQLPHPDGAGAVAHRAHDRPGVHLARTAAGQPALALAGLSGGGRGHRLRAHRLLVAYRSPSTSSGRRTWPGTSWAGRTSCPRALDPVAILALIGVGLRHRETGEQTAPAAVDELHHRGGLLDPARRAAVERPHGARSGTSRSTCGRPTASRGWSARSP